MNAFAVIRRRNALRVADAYAGRMYSITGRKRVRDRLSVTTGGLKLEIIIVVLVGALLFIH